MMNEDFDLLQFFNDGHMLKIWGPNRKKYVTIRVIKNSFYVSVGSTSETKSHNFEHALICAIGVLNSHESIDTTCDGWWLKNYTRDSLSVWYMAHNKILPEKYLESGHEFVYVLRNHKGWAENYHLRGNTLSGQRNYYIQINQNIADAKHFRSLKEAYDFISEEIERLKKVIISVKAYNAAHAMALQLKDDADIPESLKQKFLDFLSEWVDK